MKKGSFTESGRNEFADVRLKPNLRKTTRDVRLKPNLRKTTRDVRAKADLRETLNTAPRLDEL